MKHVQCPKGFTLIEALVVIVILTLAVLMTMNFASLVNKNGSLTRSVSTKNRVLAGIRDFASMPATLRASMRASNGGTPINPGLLACAGGNPTGNCKNGFQYDLTMFAPILARDPSGGILGVQAISAPLGSSTPMRIDTFGFPCQTASPQCPFLVSTSMKAQCGPAPRAPAAPPPTSAELVPLPICTVAEVIEVTYYVQLDPNISDSDPLLASFLTPATGTVTLSVVSISGNVPQ